MSKFEKDISFPDGGMIATPNEPNLEAAIYRLSKTIDALPDIKRLRASRDRLLVAAHCVINEYDADEITSPVWCMEGLRAAIAAAEEQAP